MISQGTIQAKCPAEPPPIRLELRFSSGPRTTAGFVFGAAKSCDFVLKKNAVSNVYFTITFNKCNRLVIRNLSFKNSTTVKYNRSGRKNRVSF